VTVFVSDVDFDVLTLDEMMRRQFGAAEGVQRVMNRRQEV
jgi:hypothetical protein